MSSAEFYDNFIAYQVKSGINERIVGLYKRLCRTGIHSNSSVLEIGCGIGTLTWLLLRRIGKGTIEAMDLSPQSIEFAKKYLRVPNLFLSAADILQFEPRSREFDRILLFDVIEHIPVEKHELLFQRLSQWMHDDSLLLINIPNPGYILYDQKNNPGVLQEIDQPVYIAPLATALASASLDIVKVETWSVWVRDDYQFYTVKKKKDFEEHFLSRDRNFLQKGIAWLQRRWRKMIYRYPPR